MSGTTVRIVFVPRKMHARVAMHSFATATSAVVAVRMGFGGPWFMDVAWYVGAFLGIHVAFASALAAWFVACDRAERWIRGIIEEELVRFDMRTYQREIHRIFPALKKSSDDEIE